MTSIAVVDTHALLWHGLGQRRRLGADARRLLDRVERGQGVVYVPTTVLVELGEAQWRGSISLAGGFDAWVDNLLATGRYIPVDLTVPIVRRAQRLYAIPERADRLIAATAAELGMPLVTRDSRIADAVGVDVVW